MKNNREKLEITQEQVTIHENKNIHFGLETKNTKPFDIQLMTGKANSSNTNTEKNRGDKK